jgi:hypothetical protein
MREWGSFDLLVGWIGGPWAGGHRGSMQPRRNETDIHSLQIVARNSYAYQDKFLLIKSFRRMMQAQCCKCCRTEHEQKGLIHFHRGKKKLISPRAGRVGLPYCDSWVGLECWESWVGCNAETVGLGCNAEGQFYWAAMLRQLGSHKSLPIQKASTAARSNP